MSDDEDRESRSISVLTKEEVEQLPDSIKDKLKIVVTEERIEVVRGPLPPPDLMQRYKDVVPDLPEQLVRWTEEESLHRREMEKLAFDDFRSQRKRSQFSGTLVPIVGILAAAGAVLYSPNLATAFVSTAIVIASIGGNAAARILAANWGIRRDEGNPPKDDE